MENPTNHTTQTQIVPSAAATEREVIIVTGLSGAGKTGVVRALEDLNYYCVDNLPVPMISSFLDFAFNHHKLSRIALGIDARGKQFLQSLMSELQKISATDTLACNVRIMFLDASEATLLKRYQETRRKHPLEGATSLPAAIHQEREILMPIMELADIRLDTDQFNLHELRSWVLRNFAGTCRRELVVNLISFGFKYGIPLESNLVYDVRSLPNPYFIPELRPKSGCDEDLREYLFGLTEVQEYWDHMLPFLRYSLRKSYEECRFFVTVAIGCTGGRHRSVSFVERLAAEVFDNVKVTIHHRDLHKDNKQ